MPRAIQTWPGITADIGEARRFVRRTLSSWGASDFEWAASLVVSELATNAVLHAGTPFSVAVTLADHRLHIEVADGSPAVPVLRNFGMDGATGRGICLVIELSESWGVDPREMSKSVWCVLVDGIPDGPLESSGELYAEG